MSLDKSMLVCANKIHKMRPVINDLYLLFLRIMKFGIIFLKKKYFDLFFKEFEIVPPLSPNNPLPPPPPRC